MRTQNEYKKQTEEDKKFQETKLALEKEIHKRFVKELVLRSQRQFTTQEQQAHLEQLYFDLKFINPELAFATLKASALITAKAHELAKAQQQQMLKQQKPTQRKQQTRSEDSEKKTATNKTTKPPMYKPKVQRQSSDEAGQGQKQFKSILEPAAPPPKLKSSRHHHY